MSAPHRSSSMIHAWRSAMNAIRRASNLSGGLGASHSHSLLIYHLHHFHLSFITLHCSTLLNPNIISYHSNSPNAYFGRVNFCHCSSRPNPFTWFCQTSFNYGTHPLSVSPTLTSKHQAGQYNKRVYISDRRLLVTVIDFLSHSRPLQFSLPSIEMSKMSLPFVLFFQQCCSGHFV